MIGRHIRAVIFDAFGTLVELADKRRPFAAMAHRAQVGRLFGEAVMTRCLDLSEAAAWFDVELPSAEAASLEADLEAELLSIAAYPDVAVSTQRLRAAGIRIAVLSNQAFPYGAALRHALPFAPDFLGLSCELGLMKPDARIFALACEVLGCAPDQVLMVGDDHEEDHAGAMAAGLATVRLDRRWSSAAKEAAYTIKSLHDLDGLIESGSASQPRTEARSIGYSYL